MLTNGCRSAKYSFEKWIFGHPLLISSLTMNSVFIREAKHHGLLSPIKARRGDIVDLCLGKPYVNGGTMILEADRQIIIRSPPVGPFRLIVVCCDVFLLGKS
jgi:hypothetical protein